jgi:hypothetical protein
MCLCHVGYDPRISLKGMREDVLEKRNKKIRSINAKKVFTLLCYLERAYY